MEILLNYDKKVVATTRNGKYGYNAKGIAVLIENDQVVMSFGRLNKKNSYIETVDEENISGPIKGKIYDDTTGKFIEDTIGKPEEQVELENIRATLADVVVGIQEINDKLLVIENKLSK